MFECDDLIFFYLFFFSLYVGLIINWNFHMLSFNEILSSKGSTHFFHTFACQLWRPCVTLPLPPSGIQSPALKPVLLLAKVAQPVKNFHGPTVSHDSCHDSMYLVWKSASSELNSNFKSTVRYRLASEQYFFCIFQLKPCCTWYCCVLVRSVKGRGEGRFAYLSNASKVE